MTNISKIQKEYAKKINFLDLELIIAGVIKKSREFVLAHPEYKISKNHESRINNYIKRRIKHEPLAYILGYKEFYGLDFIVNKNVLVPRPETEMLVDLAIKNIKGKKIIDIGTGSGNIIISIAKNVIKNKNYKFIAIDKSENALKVAIKNSEKNKVDKKIKFIKGDLLKPIINNPNLLTRGSRITITANLPYLSRKIYNKAHLDVRKFEPKSALYSAKEGLAHYERLFSQIKKLTNIKDQMQYTILLEISPEQKKKIAGLIERILPKSSTKFYKDLSRRWRVCEIKI